MSSTRAQDVAEILWELKRADKVAKYSTIARRAGFSPGTNDRAILTALKNVRRDWPHLQWWRAVKDDGNIEESSPQVELMKEAGFEFASGDEEGFLNVTVTDEQLMVWEDETDENAPLDESEEEVVEEPVLEDDGEEEDE